MIIYLFRKREKKECPICRKAIIISSKHVEMANFVAKIHTMLSQEVQNRRKELLIERENVVKRTAEEAAAATQQQRRAVYGFGDDFLVQEIHGFYDNVRMLTRNVALIDGHVIYANLLL